MNMQLFTQMVLVIGRLEPQSVVELNRYRGGTPTPPISPSALPFTLLQLT